MKKCFLFLALALVVCFAPTASAADTYLDSGADHLPKQSKTEIAQLLADNPHTLPDRIFDEQPSVSAPYTPGKVNPAALQTAVNRLNALRRIAGLPPVELDAALNENAQYGAVIQAAHRRLNHFPAQPADMSDNFYQKALEASSSSNLASGYTLTLAMDGFMDDSDASNIDRLGHRRWQLNPMLGKLGLGAATINNGTHTYVAEKVFDTSAPSFAYDFVAWPASGNFPNNTVGFQQLTAWSVSLNPDKYSTPERSALTVTLTRESDGHSWVFQDNERYTTADSGKYFNLDIVGYGIPNCIIFRPDGIDTYEGRYTVSIDGIKNKNGMDADISYQVNFFDAAAYTGTPAFIDMPTDAYYAAPVAWAIKKDITTGTSKTTFSPNKTCTTAQILTFLWRSQGEPMPSSTNTLTDIQQSDYFYNAALWAKENGLISGTKLNSSEPCTRSMVVSYLWKLAGQPDAANSSFTDVPSNADYAQAVSWAVKKGITNGTSETTFSPDTVCTRAQIVTFLYRAFAE